MCCYAIKALHAAWHQMHLGSGALGGKLWLFMGGPRTRQELNAILLFNAAFFGTLAWLAAAATVAHTPGWWYERGQAALALAGVVLGWIAWWLDCRARTTQAVQAAGAALAVLSIWVTSVHAVLV
jgi:hypothetical protein